MALVELAAPSERVLEVMLSKLYTKELTGDHECLWTANALGSFVRATPQQVEPATPEMYDVSQGLLHLLEHKSDQVRRARHRPPATARHRTPPHATARHRHSSRQPPRAAVHRAPPPPPPPICTIAARVLTCPAHPHVLQVRDAAISSVCDLAKVNNELATSLTAETKKFNKQLAGKLGKAVEEATMHYTAVELGSPHSS